LLPPNLNFILVAGWNSRPQPNPLKLENQIWKSSFFIARSQKKASNA
jgi:hypothetical protein